MKKKVKLLSCVWFFAIPLTVVYQAPLSMGILQARILEWVPCPPPGDVPNLGIKPRSAALHCRWILLPAELSGSPRILKWVDYPFSRGSSWPRNWTRVSHIEGGFFTSWAIREAHTYVSIYNFILSPKEIIKHHFH